MSSYWRIPTVIGPSSVGVDGGPKNKATQTREAPLFQTAIGYFWMDTPSPTIFCLTIAMNTQCLRSCATPTIKEILSIPELFYQLTLKFCVDFLRGTKPVKIAELYNVMPP